MALIFVAMLTSRPIKVGLSGEGGIGLSDFEKVFHDGEPSFLQKLQESMTGFSVLTNSGETVGYVESLVPLMFFVIYFQELFVRPLFAPLFKH